jgi:hypothetical protein
MSIFSSNEWWRELDDDATLTRKLRPDVFVPGSWDEITNVEVTNERYAPDVTPVFTRAPDPVTSPYAAGRPPAQLFSEPHSEPLNSVTEVDEMPYGAMPSLTDYASSPEPETRVAPPQRVSAPVHPATPFAPAPAALRSLPELSVPKMRAPFDSDVSTWRKTVPALRRILKLRDGVPLDPGALGSVPPPAVNDMPPARDQWSPLIMLAVAVSLVAMVVMSVIGFTSRAADAARAARTRVVSASGPSGNLLDQGKVFVDGSVQCEALPCELELAEGEHWVTVKAPGFETPPSRSISVGGEQPTRVHFELTPTAAATAAPVAVAPVAPPSRSVVDAVLAAVPTQATTAALAPQPEAPAPRPAYRAPAPATGRLNINSIPAAAVVVDGRPRGQTPVMGLRLPPGPHSVVFVFPNGKRVSRGALVRAGSTAIASARL